MVPRRALLALSLVLVSLCALPSAASAIPIAGENGRILFINGPGFANTQLFHRGVPSNTSPFGTTAGPLATGFAQQHRHPAWSPDRTKIVFAHGPAAGPYNVYILDLTTPGATPELIATGADRPAWSPDGTRIAYETATDIIVERLSDGAETNLTDTQHTKKAWKADWSPNSQTVYYSVGDISLDPAIGANATVMWQQPADDSSGGSQLLGITNTHVMQPAISPDGHNICYGRATAAVMGGVSTTLAIYTASLATPGTATEVVAPGVGAFNCAWSPDGTMVTYAQGFGNNGDIFMERADNSSLSQINLTEGTGTGEFDGNPDWAPDGRPICDDQTVTTKVNQPVTFDVECTDTGPAYELTNVRDFKDSDPTNGTVPFPDLADDPYTYTPNAGFVGTDSFRVQSFDEFGFGTDTGTITIEVQAEEPPPPPPPGAKCFGKDATITGTAGNDEIIGTSGNDVIAVLAGADVVRGGGGNDLICGGTQDDRLAGGAGRDRVGGGNGIDRVGGGGGNDRLAGNAGRDRANGGGGNDSLSGGGQNDRLTGGAGRDRIKGAQGRDRLSGNGGRDRLNGGSGRDRCAGNSGIDTATSCERTTGIP